MLVKSYRMKFYVNARHAVKMENADCRVHPHTWEIALYIQKKDEVFFRFTEIERDIQFFLSMYEGHLINEVPPFNVVNPTTEAIGEVVYEQIIRILDANGWALCRLEISENPTRTYIISKEDFPIGPKDKKGESGGIKGITRLALFDGGTASAAARERGETENKRLKQTLMHICKKIPPLRIHPVLFNLLVLLAASVLLILWITRKGLYPWGSDTAGHLFKVHLLYTKFMSGDIFPLYTDLWYNGIQPFRYWAPLPYYILLVIEICTGGNTILSYNIFLVLVFIAGGLGWICWGTKTGRHKMALGAALLWFFLPDNLRVTFSEGNIPRVVVSTIFPYLLLEVWDYLENRKRKGIVTISVCMLLITLSHAMIAAMVGITLFLYVLWYGIVNKKIRHSAEVLVIAICGVLLSGGWLYPGLKGGLMSLDQGAVNEVMKNLTFPVTQSLNPFLRLRNVEVFYFGISVAVVSVFGLLFGNKRSKAGFGVTLLIFLGTTKAMLFLFLKLPMSQLFWMMRFTPLAMAVFLTGLLLWDSLRKEVLALFLLFVVLDSVVSFKLLCYDVPFPQNLQSTLQPAIDMAVQRIAVLDGSEFGSFPSYYTSFNASGRELQQVYGWAWQGAKTAQNIVWLNTGLEKGWYAFMFDRALEIGADTLVVKADKVKDMDAFLKEASRQGYEKKTETNLSIIFKYPVNHTFATRVQYTGLAIGKHACNMAYIFPQFEVGGSGFIDDYSIDSLKRYRVIFLSGFQWKNRVKAENMVKELASEGVRFVIDLTGVACEMNTSRAGFLGVIAQPVRFRNNLPELQVNDLSMKTKKIPDMYLQWDTFYLEGLDSVNGSARFGEQAMTFLGTKINSNIYFVGFNLPYFALETKDENVLKLLEGITGMERYRTPPREIVKIDMSSDKNYLRVQSEKEGVLLGTACIDAFQGLEGRFTEMQNLIFMESKEIKLKINYPYFVKGLCITLVGMIAVALFYFFIYRRRVNAAGSASGPVGSDT